MNASNNSRISISSLVSATNSDRLVRSSYPSDNIARLRSARTLKRIEAGAEILKSNLPTIAAVRTAWESAGIEFIGAPDDDSGIRILTNRNGG
jgi:hypothetical protein